PAVERMPCQSALSTPGPGMPARGIPRPGSGQPVAIRIEVLLRPLRVLLAGDVQVRARHVPRLLRRLGARRDGLPVLQLRDPDADGWMAPLQGAGRDAPDHHPA